MRACARTCAGYEGTAAAAVVSRLTTSGKPLSAIAFGYDVPVWSTATMEATGTTTLKLKEPYMPTLRPRFVRDHPALEGSGAAEEKGTPAARGAASSVARG